MVELTVMTRRALEWLKPGVWQAAELSVDRGLRRLARARPDLCEVRVVKAGDWPMAEYRLTAAGRRMRDGTS